VTPVVVARARSHASLYRMVEGGAGVALVDHTIGDRLSGAQVVFRPIDPPITRGVAAIVNARVAQSIATRAFLDCLRLEISRTKK